MADPNRNVNPGTGQKARGRTSMLPGIIIGSAIVVLVLIVLWIAKQPRIAAQPNGPTRQVSKQVRFDHLAVTSQGGGFNIQGMATNEGNRPITRMTVQVDFKGLNGTTLESPVADVLNGDGTDLASKPLPPNQAQPVEIKLDHAPQGWDQKPPELQVKTVQWTSEQQPASSGPASSGKPREANEPNGGR